MPPKKRKVAEVTIDLSTAAAFKAACLRLYEIKDQLANIENQLSQMRAVESQLETSITQILVANKQGHIEVSEDKQIVLDNTSQEKEPKPNVKDYEEIVPKYMAPEALQQMQAEMAQRVLSKKSKPAVPRIKVQRREMVDV